MTFPKWGLAFLGAWLWLTAASLGCAAPASPTPAAATTPTAAPAFTATPAASATPTPQPDLPATVEVLVRQRLAEALAAPPAIASTPGAADTPAPSPPPTTSPVPPSSSGRTAAATPHLDAGSPSPPEWQTYYSSGGGYLMVIAPGWKVEARAGDGVMVSGPDGGDFALLHVFPMDSAGRALDALVDDVIDFRRSEARTGFQLLDRSDITFASGLKGVRVEYLSRTGPGYCPTRTIDALVLAGPRAFELLASVCQEFYQGYQADIAAMLHSFFPLASSPAPTATPPPTLLPTATAVPQPTSASTPAPAPARTPDGSGCREGQVDVNSAPKEELVSIIHIGESRAEQLVQLRPLRSLDDLKRIDGIGDARVADIKAEGIACVGD